LIYLMRDGEPEHRELIRTIIREDGFDGAHRERILALVREYGTADRVLDKASEYACQARKYLAGFPPCQARDALLVIPEYIVERDR
jgi:octaprenyl-diphosphate synthase